MVARKMPRNPLAIACAFGLIGVAAFAAAQVKRDFAVSARKYEYRVGDQPDAVIKVRQDDLVRVRFTAEDIPHSFTIDEYRISRRAERGKPISFEFHANQVGTFRIYCNLTIDDRCLRELQGTLIVEPR
jgi:heme/copper-type cytochrome/quinol oxidase subunit 2